VGNPKVNCRLDNLDATNILHTMTRTKSKIKAAASILLVEDSPTAAEMYVAFLEMSGYNVEWVDTGKKALKAITNPGLDLMVLDLGLPDIDGLQILRSLDSEGVSVPVIVVTGNASVLGAVEAMQLGAMDFLMKPCSEKKLEAAVAHALERLSSSRMAKEEDEAVEDDEPKQGPSGFLGQSSSMRNVFALIESVARSTASVFITGESGTGKELCSEAIHKSSPRHNGAFVAINCAAIPRELMESEIFGHRKGAFTGAYADQEGAASLSDGGTMFLDEICDLPIDLQVKLLRFIQTGVYKRVGDIHERSTDVRFICATNRDPMEEVRCGRFREDLYYRLHVIPIHMPPLRERGNDIALLAERFLIDYAAIENKEFKRFDDTARLAITKYSWPGNVRQLQNAIRQVVVLNSAEFVTIEMLPGSVRDFDQATTERVVKAQPEAEGFSANVQFQDLLIRPLEELEMMAINAALEKFNGNISQAARVLEISTSTIYRKKEAWEKG